MQRVSKKVAPFAYLSPTLLLMAVLSLLPIGMVLSYSLMDNVIMNKNPVFVGINNYIELLTDDVFQQAIGNTLYFTAMSVIFHLILGLSFAMLLNTSLLGATTKAIFRVVYVLPWVFTATIIAILWRLMLNPNGVINYLIISAGFADRPIEWLKPRQLALHAVTFINIWSGYPFYMVSLLASLRAFPMNSTKPAPSTGPTDANSSASSPCRNSSPSSSVWPCWTSSGPCTVHADLDDHRRRADPRHRDVEHVHVQGGLQFLRVRLGVGQRVHHSRPVPVCGALLCAAAARQR
ncbi:MAG: sugar ABC transporter permease [Caldilineaceae bacterium]